jgi:RNA ligase (TIGR02306 family)
MERKLATIAKIDEIRPHPNADALELARIRGWQVVVKIGEFKPGDLCVYVEIDSVMPERPEFEFLAPRKYRIKTTKLRGEVSQGIAFPLRILDSCEKGTVSHYPYHVTIDGSFYDLQPGLNVTKVLGVTKYEEPIPACLGGTAAGRFPSHSIRTDEERIQNLMDHLEEYRCFYLWTATEKLDGSSVTYSIFNDEFQVSSRNLQLKETEKNSFWKFARENYVEEEMRKFMDDAVLNSLTLQGELLGEGIQGNKYKLKGQTVRFFRVFDPVAYRFFSVEMAKKTVEHMGFEFVPIIETDMTLPETVEELLAYADGRSALYDTAREGVVFVAESTLPGIYLEGPLEGRSARPLEDYQNRLSFKVISNKFILKHDL